MILTPLCVLNVSLVCTLLKTITKIFSELKNNINKKIIQDDIKYKKMKILIDFIIFNYFFHKIFLISMISFN